MSEERDGRDWGLVALIGACALLLGLLDVLLIPLYVGSVPLPLAVVLAVAVAVVLPRWAYATVASGMAAAVPFVAWLAPVFVLPLYPRAEGDVLVTGGGAEQFTFYGVVLLGCVAGFATIMKITTPKRPAAPISRARPGQPDRARRANR